MKKRYKFSFVILLIAAITLSSMAYLQLSTIKGNRQQVKELKEQVTLLENEKNLISKRILADDLFFNGDYEKALNAYNEIIHEIEDADFIKSREKSLKNLNELVINLERSEKEGKSKLVSTKNRMEGEMKKVESESNKKIDSLMILLIRERQEAELKIAKLHNEIENKPVLKSIVFYSRNGTKTTYYGEVRKGKAAGTGVGYYSTGSMYLGPWQDNQRHGSGAKFTWLDGDRYEGDYINDKREGIGTYYWKNGERYEGEWKDDKRNGFGILYGINNQEKLKGEWKNDELIRNDS